MITRTEELCRKLRPVLGRKVDALWNAYLADSDADGRADIEQTLALLAAKHLGTSYQPDRSPFPPPPREFAVAGDIPLGRVAYANRKLFPLALNSRRLKEHVLIAGRSGSGKTNLTFILMQGIMKRGIKVLALDWKRGYRDLVEVIPDLRVYTIGRDVAPFRFNPLIPPPGCEITVWIKNIVDVIASAYLGGEGVISLLVAGLDHLYNEASKAKRWPTIQDLLAWLRGVKLRGRAAMWQASAERILLAMMYGEFAAVLNTQDNRHVLDLLKHNVILEMDGLSSSADRVLFSEALVLYLYRHLLARGPSDELTNVIVLEEAHNLLLAKQVGSRRKGNAIRQSLQTAGLVEPVPIATRSGQIMLCELTDAGRAAAEANGIDPGRPSRASLEHRFWVARAAAHFERQGYELTREHYIPGDGHVDLVAERPGERVAIEVETGKSDIGANLAKLRGVGFDRVVLVATSPSAVAACQRASERRRNGTPADLAVSILTWLDLE